MFNFNFGKKKPDKKQIIIISVILSGIVATLSQCTGASQERLWDLLDELQRNLFPQTIINDILLQDIEKYPPPAWKGKYIKIKYVTQLPTKNPVFAFFCNLPQYIKEPYTRYLENRLRENFDFEGVPIKIVYKNK
mgnify:CR=1 FL=1